MATAKKTTTVKITASSKTPAKAAPGMKGAAVKPAGKSAEKPAGKHAAPAKSASARPSPPKGVSKKGGKDLARLFRINIEVGDLDAAERFYARLFGVEGRRQAGERVYFTAGAVTLQIVDVSATGKPHPSSKSLYFLVRDLDPVFERAKALGCLSRETVHGQPGGEVRVRPWGERSFYVQDRWKNPLCFVQEGTHTAG
ncbi:MAG: hypothetical protein HZA53_02330 [Planctomycetes bacterium]|nr:hypothetical protein [Planctomycetota bacterium]